MYAHDQSLNLKASWQMSDHVMFCSDMTSPQQIMGTLFAWSRMLLALWLVELDNYPRHWEVSHFYKLGFVLLEHYSDDTSNVFEVSIATGNRYESVIATVHRSINTVAWSLLLFRALPSEVELLLLLPLFCLHLMPGHFKEIIISSGTLTIYPSWPWYLDSFMFLLLQSFLQNLHLALKVINLLPVMEVSTK